MCQPLSRIYAKSGLNQEILRNSVYSSLRSQVRFIVGHFHFFPMNFGKFKALRTSDERFSNLPDFRFAPHFMSDLPGYEALRLHFLDEGKKDNYSEGASKIIIIRTMSGKSSRETKESTSCRSIHY